ncbi:SRPBCC family protein [Chitinophaga lutea]
MKILKKILLTLLVLIVLLVIISFFLPSDYSTKRTATLNSTPECVFNQFNDFNNWRQWNAFDDSYKEVEYTTSDPSSGAGAKQSWVANKNETGTMTITESVPGQRVKFNIVFGGFDDPMYGDIQLEAVPEGTRVTWENKGRMGNNPLYKWMGLFMDKMMGSAIDKSFDNIRKICEK